jgi:hypothetical protein
MKNIICTLFLIVGSLVHGQDPTDTSTTSKTTDPAKKQEELEARIKELESPGHNRFWQGNINGDEIMVAVDRIGSISRATYVLNGAVIVHEVVIDTLGGQSLTKIYCFTPITDGMAANGLTKVVDRARDLVDNQAARAGTKVHQMVNKTSDSVRAHSVEFQLQTVQEIDALYGSLKATWITGKGRVFTIK